jgi:hypothetical protein
MNFPEHDKLSKIRDESQVIGEFLEWLYDEKEVILCKVRGDEYADTYGLHSPVNLNTQDLLADFFEIDLTKLEQEKQQMLDALRK